MSRVKNLSGKRFGNFIVLDRAPNSKSGRVTWNCLCDCGKPFVRQSNNITSKRPSTYSCGCLMGKTHGMTSSPTYKTWEMMIQRCTNENFDGYPRYGGRGIQLDYRWRVFENFLEDMGVRPEGKTLDRIDVNGDYCKDNCKWSDQTTQLFNRRPLREGKRTGVYFHKASGKWTAQINFQGKNYHLGLFSDINDAITAREVAEMKFYGEVKEGLAEADDMETMS